MTRFGYLRDPLCVGSLTIYAVNKLVLLPHFGGLIRAHAYWTWSFLHGHLSDVLLLPAALPLVLALHRSLNWRTHDGPPGWGEMTGHWVVWSVLCKFVGPFWLHIGVADPWDLLCFAAGGILACLWWHRPRWQSPESGL